MFMSVCWGSYLNSDMFKKKRVPKSASHCGLCPYNLTKQNPKPTHSVSYFEAIFPPSVTLYHENNTVDSSLPLRHL